MGAYQTGHIPNVFFLELSQLSNGNGFIPIGNGLIPIAMGSSQFKNGCIPNKNGSTPTWAHPKCFLFGIIPIE